ncbi:RraA family protein [Clostridium lacusfryxellense]|uniref:RraA family protein n=1 Tax=Clostridium lacusfryxellense TaxID=205328 RepID=UPI001C0D92F4|nr:RraA family protein [Clostridium lacusfryxellense]MBU3113858.1 RraA family protein [Clostridium lacusfryxellense]
MDLDKLKEQRDKLTICELPISEKELCDRYEKVFTAAVNDVLREFCYLQQALPPSIMALREDMRVAGIAFTIKGSKNLTLENEMQQRAKMLEAIREDSVCVWDTSGDEETTQWGGIMTMASKRRGCRGAVVDGGARDVKEILDQDFPVFCKFKSSNGMLGRFRMIGYQMPIMIGNVFIYPGDIIFGDMDGVIVVPRKIAYDVLIKAEYIKENEKEIRDMILEGLTPTQVVEKGGYF